MFYRKRMKWRRKLRITNQISDRYYINSTGRNSKKNKYKRKSVNGDEGPLDRGPTYGRLSNGYNHIRFPKVHLDGFVGDEYSSMRDQSLRHNGVMIFLYED